MSRTLLTLFLLSACTAGGSSADDEGPGSGERTACSELFPGDVPGHVWEYRQEDTAGIDTWIWESMGRDDYDGVPAYQMLVWGDVDDDNIVGRLEVRSWYSCEADGLHYLAQEESFDGTVAGFPVGELATTRYDSAPLVYPLDWAVGDVWTSDYVGETIDRTGTEQLDYTIRFEILREEVLEVPAGTFDTVVVDIGNVARSESHLDYYSPGVGLIQGDNHTLMAFQ